MYGTKWCGDYARTKQVFAQHNINYTWIDITYDESACAYVKKVKGDSRACRRYYSLTARS